MRSPLSVGLRYAPGHVGCRTGGRTAPCSPATAPRPATPAAAPKGEAAARHLSPGSCARGEGQGGAGTGREGHGGAGRRREGQGGAGTGGSSLSTLHPSSSMSPTGPPALQTCTTHLPLSICLLLYIVRPQSSGLQPVMLWLDVTRGPASALHSCTNPCLGGKGSKHSTGYSTNYSKFILFIYVNIFCIMLHVTQGLAPARAR